MACFLQLAEGSLKVVVRRAAGNLRFEQLAESSLRVAVPQLQGSLQFAAPQPAGELRFLQLAQGFLRVAVPQLAGEPRFLQLAEGSQWVAGEQQSAAVVESHRCARAAETCLVQLAEVGQLTTVGPPRFGPVLAPALRTARNGVGAPNHYPGLTQTTV